MPSEDGIARHYVTILRDELTPLDLYVGTTQVHPKAALSRLGASDQVNGHPTDALPDLIFGLYEGPLYYPYPPFDPEFSSRAFRARSRAYDETRAFVNRALDQPIAIELSPVSGKSLSDLMKTENARLYSGTAVGLAAVHEHSYVPILVVGAAIIVVSLSSAVATRMMDWLTRHLR